MTRTEKHFQKRYQACEKAEWEIHAYCLMTNHFHIIRETLKPTLVAGMKWFLGT